MACWLARWRWDADRRAAVEVAVVVRARRPYILASGRAKRPGGYAKYGGPGSGWATRQSESLPFGLGLQSPGTLAALWPKVRAERRLSFPWLAVALASCRGHVEGADQTGGQMVRAREA